MQDWCSKKGCVKNPSGTCRWCKKMVCDDHFFDDGVCYRTDCRREDYRRFSRCRKSRCIKRAYDKQNYCLDHLPKCHKAGCKKPACEYYVSGSGSENMFCEAHIPENTVMCEQQGCNKPCSKYICQGSRVQPGCGKKFCNDHVRFWYDSYNDDDHYYGEILCESCVKQSFQLESAYRRGDLSNMSIEEYLKPSDDWYISDSD